MPDLFVPLCAGGTAFAPPRDVVADTHRFIAWLAGNEISLLHCTPSRWRELLAETSLASATSLRHVLLAGEIVRAADVTATHSLFGERVQLWNLYGPTEATLVKLHHRIRIDDASRPSIPIGRAMPGASVRIVDDNGGTCATGTVGEIAIRSPFASHGYLDEPELNARRFHADGSGEVEYLTGDLGAIDADGLVSFHGRRDRQIKLNGARVDVDEVEAIFASCAGVIESAVVPDADHTALFAFLVCDRSSLPSIRTEAAARLSGAMRVARVAHCDSLPRTASGKIDRGALARTLEVA